MQNEPIIAPHVAENKTPLLRRKPKTKPPKPPTNPAIRHNLAASGTIANRGGICLSRTSQELPRTLGALRKSSFAESRLASRTVKDELRNNLICKIQRGENLFSGILGFEDTVVPQVINAVLSRHNFILLGLRGQAKTRLVRMLTTLLDEAAPYLEGCEIHDNPYRPIGWLGIWGRLSWQQPPRSGERSGRRSPVPGDDRF